MSDLRRDLGSVLNRYSMENGSNTTDFILADYLIDCLTAFDSAIQKRATWYGRMDQPGQSDAPSPPTQEAGT
jgi:hypothetical protein